MRVKRSKIIPSQITHPLFLQSHLLLFQSSMFHQNILSKLFFAHKCVCLKKKEVNIANPTSVSKSFFYIL